MKIHIREARLFTIIFYPHQRRGQLLLNAMVAVGIVIGAPLAAYVNTVILGSGRLRSTYPHVAGVF